MTVKVNELAKELNMEATELLDRIRGMGIAAESETSEIGDIDAVAAKNTILRSRSASETKIVKAAPKKSVKEESEEPKVVVKAAQIKPPVKRPVSQQARNDAAKTAAADIGTAEKAVQRPTVTKPAAFARDGEVRRKPPIGKPVISKELEEREKGESCGCGEGGKGKRRRKGFGLKGRAGSKSGRSCKESGGSKASFCACSSV